MAQTATGRADWEVAAQDKRKQLEKEVHDIIQGIPPLEIDLPSNVTRIPKRVLLDSDVQITETPAEILVQQIATGKLSSLEVTRAFVQRAATASRLVNCATEFMTEAAEERARYLDDYLQRNGRTVGPLHGLPISAKEHMKLKGLDCNASFVSLIGSEAQSDALIAQVLLQAGCIFYVRTTEPQTLMQLETSNNIYGVTVNPYNRSLTAGGSSGGEGALLGLHGSCLGIGSDIGGSIRSPAASNGVFGLRPTSYRLPLDGFVAASAGPGQVTPVVGPLSTSLAGIELFMKTIIDAEPWTRDSALVPMPWRSSSRLSTTGAGIKRKFRIGVLIDDGIVRPHPPILRALAVIRKKLEDSDEFDVLDFAPYKHDEAWRIINSLYFADGGVDIKNALEASGEPLRPLSRFILEENPRVKSLTVREVSELKAQRDRYRDEYLAHRNNTMASLNTDKPKGSVLEDRAVDHADLILCPAGPGCALPLNTSKYWPYTSQWNLLDYPAIVFPTRMTGVVSDRQEAYVPRNERDVYNQSLCESRSLMDSKESC